MSSIKEYLEKMSTEQLEHFLQLDIQGRGNMPMETILTIMEILEERDPRECDAQAALRVFREHYTPEAYRQAQLCGGERKYPKEKNG